MHFNTKFTTLLVIAASAFTAAHAAALESRVRDACSLSSLCLELTYVYFLQKAAAELSVVFYDDINLTGASFSADDLVPGVCNTLPGNWLDRPESVNIAPGFACTLYE